MESFLDKDREARREGEYPLTENELTAIVVSSTDEKEELPKIVGNRLTNKEESRVNFQITENAIRYEEVPPAIEK